MMSQRARYAFKALIHIAAADGQRAMQSREIAAAEHVPQPFLEQILIDLKRGGLLTSQRGKDGGYRLARPADGISLAQVLRLIDGPVAPLRCLSHTAYRRCADCSDETACRLRQLFGDVFATLLQSLETRMLSDVLVSDAELERSSQYVPA